MMINESTKVRLGYLGTIEGKNMYENAQKNPEAIISLYKENEIDKDRTVPVNKDFFKVNIDAYSYYFFSLANRVDIFVELPLVEDDELFSWVDKRFGHCEVLWTKLKKGLLIFNCSYNKITKNTSVNIFWEREQIGHLLLANATNEDILSAINEWTTTFEGQVVNSVTNKKLVKAS